MNKAELILHFTTALLSSNKSGSKDDITTKYHGDQVTTDERKRIAANIMDAAELMATEYIKRFQ